MNGHIFNPASGPILVKAEITGPAGSAVVNLVLDTGATMSLLNLATVLSLGIDPDQTTRQVTMTTGSGSEVVPVILLTRLSALGQHRFGFPAIAHALPASSGVDGLLGLDFFRQLSLTIDFRAGRIALA